MSTSVESMIYDFIVDNGIATEDEIQLVTCICGYNEKALNDIIHVRTEYHDAEQCVQCEPEGFYMRPELSAYYGLDEEETDEED